MDDPDAHVHECSFRFADVIVGDEPAVAVHNAPVLAPRGPGPGTRRIRRLARTWMCRAGEHEPACARSPDTAPKDRLHSQGHSRAGRST